MNSRTPLILCCLFSLFFIQNSFAQQVNYDVLFHSGSAQLDENYKTDLDILDPSPEEVFGGKYLRLVQFYSNPNELERQSIENMGLRFLDYIPHFTHLMAIPQNFDWSQLEENKIRSVVKIEPYLKLHSKLTAELNVGGPFVGEHIELILTYPKMYEVDEIEEACITNGITVMESSRYSSLMKVSVPLDLVVEKSSLPFIQFLEMAPGPPIPDDIRGRNLHRSNVIDSEYPSGYHFNGEGVNVQVRDDGKIGPHIDFQGRVDNSYQPGGSGSHETRVASTLGGAGNIDPYARGMADGAFMFGTNYEASFFDVTMDLHFDEGVVITNSSYSNGCNDGYASNTVTVDEQTYYNPTLIHVFSAGNSNGSDCGYGAGAQWGNITGGHKVGKNAIATANIEYDGSIVQSSSRGPAEDGRIKPDLSAQGVVYAALPDNNYQNTSGTSFSSPSVVGVLAQLYQAYKTWNAGVNPPSALMKACLLNTANDLGHAGPDFKYGWGHLNAYKAMKTIESNNYFSDQLEENDENLHTLIIPDSVQQFKLMVYWSDFPGSTFSSKALVNNLDIELVDTDGNVLLPYLLDPTPNVITLNLPAGNGVDDLNNMEQIVIDNPAPGSYTLRITGTEVPIGPQEYFVLWEEVYDEIMLTYPVGGECLRTGIQHVIHWDAFGSDGNFLLEYSANDGVDWNNIATVGGSIRSYDWSVPTTFTGKAMVRISRNGIEDTSKATFSIMNPPGNIEVIAACPNNYITLTWNSVDDATEYVAYVLGDQYMDSVAITSTDTVNVPMGNLGEPVWYAVSSIGPDGACSPRSIAQMYDGPEFNCIYQVDVALLEGNIQEGDNYFCGPFDEALTVEIYNPGLTTQSDITISYELNGGPLVTESFAGTLMPGESGFHTFTNTLDAVLNQTNTIVVWIEVPLDEWAFNNILDFSFDLYDDVNIASFTFTEDFESGVFPPTDWKLKNPDGSYTWASNIVTGPFGDQTNVLFMDNSPYDDFGQRDIMVSMPIDLTTAVNPVLSFDVAHARYLSAAFKDTLYIEVQTICVDNVTAELVYSKNSSELATHSPAGNNWEPDFAEDWRNDVVDLSAYAGEVVILNFINATQSGNGIFIDNINLFSAEEPASDFDIITTAECVDASMTFSNTSTGTISSYQWDFGDGAVPGASTAPGPIDVTYASVGTKTISLITTGPLGEDTYTTTIDVGPLPEANYSFTELDGTYTFTNLSTFADTYLWDFGDSNTSMDENPVHTYATSGDYTIELTVTNDCGSETYTVTVSVIITNTSELENNFQVSLSPNPGTDEVFVLIENMPIGLNQIELYNATGKMIKTVSIDSADRSGKYRVETAELPAGVYWIKLLFEEDSKSSRWVKM